MGICASGPNDGGYSMEESVLSTYPMESELLPFLPLSYRMRGIVKGIEKAESPEDMPLLAVSGRMPPSSDAFGWLGPVPDVNARELDGKTERRIGKGGYGAVLVITHLPTGRAVAEKRLRKAGEGGKYFNREHRALERVRGVPFATQLLGVVTRDVGEKSDEASFLLSFGGGGDLLGRLRQSPFGRLPESHAKFYFAELLVCIEGVHERGLIFRDLKPENVCIDSSGHVMLVDFGLASMMDDIGRAVGRAGTSHFLSPEMLSPHVKEYGVDESSDWWSYGCSLFEVLTGGPPFGDEDSTRNEVYFNIVTGRKRALPWDLSRSARSLLSGLLKSDQNSRLKTAEAIRRHDFFHGIDWQALRERRIMPPWLPRLSATDDTRYFQDGRSGADNGVLPGSAVRRKHSKVQPDASKQPESVVLATGSLRSDDTTVPTPDDIGSSPAIPRLRSRRTLSLHQKQQRLTAKVEADRNSRSPQAPPLRKLASARPRGTASPVTTNRRRKVSVNAARPTVASQPGRPPHESPSPAQMQGRSRRHIGDAIGEFKRSRSTMTRAKYIS